MAGTEIIIVLEREKGKKASGKPDGGEKEVNVSSCVCFLYMPMNLRGTALCVCERERDSNRWTRGRTEQSRRERETSVGRPDDVFLFVHMRIHTFYALRQPKL